MIGKNDLEELIKQQKTDIDKLKNYLLYLMDEVDLKKVSSKFNDVLANCNEVDFMDEETSLAYAFLHLLDRYYRFLYMQRILVENRCIPYSPHEYICMHSHGGLERVKRLGILDVGTGPGPALMAFSDFYDWLKKHTGEEYDVVCDYVEKSTGFRRFLHAFLEKTAMWKQELECKDSHLDYMNIPFHNGSFYDFSGIDQRGGGRYRDIKIHYDLLIMSNFLTTEDMVESFKQDIINTTNMLRDKGIFMLVGACSGKSRKYESIYKKIDEMMSEPFAYRPYKNRWKYTGSWEKVYCDNIEIDYPLTNMGSVVCDYFKELKQRLQQGNIWMGLPGNVTKAIESGCCETNADSWHLAVYKKRVVNHQARENARKQRKMESYERNEGDRLS